MVDLELEELKREFLAEARQKVAEMESRLEGKGDRAAFERLTYLAHQLKGSGGSYGFQSISTDAAELEWECRNLFAAVRTTPRSLETVIRIPFASLHSPPPRDGATWRGNLFRIDRSGAGDEFMAWRPTLKSPADFHVAAAFGRLQFR